MPAAGAMRSVRAVAGVDRLQQDALFLQQLQLTKCGRVLQDHASCVLHRVDRGGHEGAIEECSNWRRTFIYGLNKALAEGKPAPFGLPLPVGRRVLPKYIAIVNLSGERMLLYSEQDTLLRMLWRTPRTLWSTLWSMPRAGRRTQCRAPRRGRCRSSRMSRGWTWTGTGPSARRLLHRSRRRSASCWQW